MDAITETKTIQELNSCNKTAMEKTDTAAQSPILIPLDCVFLDELKTAHKANPINK